MAPSDAPERARGTRRRTTARLLRSGHGWIYGLALSASVHAAGLLGLTYVRSSASNAIEVESRDDVVLRLDLRTTSMIAMAANEGASSAQLEMSENAPTEDELAQVAEQPPTDVTPLSDPEPQPQVDPPTVEHEPTDLAKQEDPLPPETPISDAPSPDPIPHVVEDSVPAVVGDTSNPRPSSDAPNAGGPAPHSSDARESRGLAGAPAAPASVPSTGA